MTSKRSSLGPSRSEPFGICSHYYSLCLCQAEQQRRAREKERETERDEVTGLWKQRYFKGLKPFEQLHLLRCVCVCVCVCVLWNMSLSHCSFPNTTLKPTRADYQLHQKSGGQSVRLLSSSAYCSSKRSDSRALALLNANTCLPEWIKHRNTKVDCFHYARWCQMHK